MNLGLAPYNELLLVTLLFAVIVLFFMYIVMSIKMARYKKRLKRLWKGTEKQSLETMLIKASDNMRDMKEENAQLKSEMKLMQASLKERVGYLGIVRYNAFNERGNDLSYSVAFLNEANDGVVFTSIYNREQSSTYAKPIENGTSKYLLSDEEQEALAKAKASVMK